MQITILGAGVLGITTAYMLEQHGHSVTVVDRRPAAAMETSFANGGQLSYSHAEPWANPAVLPKIAKWPYPTSLMEDFMIKTDNNIYENNLEKRRNVIIISHINQF
jgi:D-amino-acid dehydrogenase